MEHHVSVASLLSVGNYSSAAALLRPLMEAGASAFWLVYACPPAHLQDLLEGRSETPTLPTMLRRLSKVQGLHGVRALAAMLPKEGRYLDSYTHGGMAQIGQRDWKLPFDLQRNLHTVMASDMFVLAGVAIATVIYHAPRLFDYLGERRDQIAQEIEKRTGTAPKKEAWKPFPMPTLA